MKLIMLNMEFPPIGGGAANANYYLLKGLSNNQKIDIDLVTSSPNNIFEKKEFSKKIRVIKLNINKTNTHYWSVSEIIMWTWKTYWMTKSLLKKENYNLIHCWFGWPAGIIGYLFKKKVPYIIALRGSDVPGYNIRLKNLDKYIFKIISKIVWQKARAITTNSNFLRELAQKTCNNNIIINVIYNGIDCDKFKPVITNNEKFTILFVGRLISRKGVYYLLKAFKELYLENFNCHLNIVGLGPEKETLLTYCKKNGIEREVTFLGKVNVENIAGIYNQADVFVLPSLSESMANVILEAMASGLPIITTNTGAAELIDGNGFIVKKGDYKMIKEAIIDYINNPLLLKRHGILSRKISEQMSWENSIHSYLKIYNRIIE